MTRHRRAAHCGAADQFYAGDEWAICTLPLNHRIDEHYDRRRGHWWPRRDAPTLPTPEGADAPPDDHLF